MFKKFIAICATALAFTSCSFNNSESAPDSAIRFIQSNRDYYNNGVFYGKDTTMFLDFDTMENAPFCAKPNCNHTASDCIANICGSEPIIYKDYAYFFNSNNGAVRETNNEPEFYIESKLMRASLETSEIETVCEFSDCAPPQTNGSYVINSGSLYFIGDNLCPYKDEYGVISYSNVGGEHYLCCVNLDTGDYTNYGSIYDGDKAYEMADNSSGAFITGIYNGKMYIQYVFMKESPDKLGVTPEENWTRVNFEYDFMNSKLSESKLPAAVYAADDSYVYLDYSAKETVVINNGKTYHIPHFDLYNTETSVYNGKIFFNSSWYDLKDLSEHSLGKYENCDVVAYYNNSYIIINGGKCIKLSEDDLLALDKG